MNQADDAHTSNVPPTVEAKEAAGKMPATLAHTLRPRPDRRPHIATTTDPDPVSDDGDDDDDGAATAAGGSVLPRRFAPAGADAIDDTPHSPPNGQQPRPPSSLDANGDLLSVSTREVALTFTPVYHRRMASSPGASRSGANPLSQSFVGGRSADTAASGRTTEQRRPSSPSPDELANAITPAHRATPFGTSTSIRALSPATQARVNEARRRARQLRKSLGRSGTGQDNAATNM